MPKDIMLRQKGFSLLEMSIVLVLVGTLVAIGMPILKLSTTQAKLHTERKELNQASKALIGYILAKGGAPDYPNDGGGSNLTYQLPSTKLGLPARSTYASHVHYQPNAAIKFADEAAETAGDTLNNLCTALQNQIDEFANASTPLPLPAICNGTASCDNTDDAQWSSVAFTLIGKGPNYRLDLENAVDNGYYENPARSFGNDYEDVVVTMSLLDLYDKIDCNSILGGGGGGGGGGGPPGGGLSCGGNSPIYIINSGDNPVYFRVGGNSCFSLQDGLTISLCPAGATTNIRVNSDAACANGSAVLYSLNGGDDTNGDDVVTLACGNDLNNCTVD